MISTGISKEEDEATKAAIMDAYLRMEFTPSICKVDDDDDVIDDSYPEFENLNDHSPAYYELIVKERRDSRKCLARYFRSEYSFGRCFDGKTLVCPGGTYLWEDKSSGIIWVGVHGLDSICVVTRTGDLDLTRVHSCLKYETIEEVLFRFRKTMVAEIEDLASPSSELVNYVSQGTLKPFGVVSVIRGTGNDHKDCGVEIASSDEDEEVEGSQTSSSLSNEQMMDGFLKDLLIEGNSLRQLGKGPKDPEFDAKKTVKYLRDQMERNATIQQEPSTMYYEKEAVHFLQEKTATMKMEDFTVDETIKTAITTFQHLFNKKFNAEEIEVTVMDPNYFFSYEEPRYKDVDVKELVKSDIEEYLAAINGPGGSYRTWCHKGQCQCHGGADFWHIASPTIPFRKDDIQFDNRGRRSLSSYYILS